MTMPRGIDPFCFIGSYSSTNISRLGYNSTGTRTRFICPRPQIKSCKEVKLNSHKIPITFKFHMYSKKAVGLILFNIFADISSLCEISGSRNHHLPFILIKNCNQRWTKFFLRRKTLIYEI